MLQLTRQGMRLAGPPDQLDRWHADFERLCCVRLPGLIEPDLLATIETGIDGAEFIPFVHDGKGVVPPPEDLRMTHNGTSALLQFLGNDPAFLKSVSTITGVRVAGFSGTVRRFVPGRHFDTWHNDIAGGRLAALSVNLGREAFEGGVLQLRHWDTGRNVCEIANTGIGDAVLFKIDESLKHRITALEGTVARTIFAGFFFATPVLQLR